MVKICIFYTAVPSCPRTAALLTAMLILPISPHFYSITNETKHRDELSGCRVPIFKGFQPKTTHGFNGTTHPAVQSVCLSNREKKKQPKKSIILIKTEKKKKGKSKNTKKQFRLGRKRTYVFLLRVWLQGGKKPTGLTTSISDPFPKSEGFGPKKVTLTDFPVAFLWNEKRKKKIKC